MVSDLQRIGKARLGVGQGFPCIVRPRWESLLPFNSGFRRHARDIHMGPPGQTVAGAGYWRKSMTTHGRQRSNFWVPWKHGRSAGTA